MSVFKRAGNKNLLLPLFLSACLLQLLDSSAQNVGIGTTTPQAKLDVKGNFRAGVLNNFLLYDSSGRFSWSNSYLWLPSSQYIIQHSNSAEGLYYGNSQLEYRYQDGTPRFFTNWSSGYGYFYGRLGIGTINPLAKLHVADSAVVFSAAGDVTFPASSVPVSGQGRRMLWYPDKAAFRVGYDNGTAWDKDSIGFYSFASGYGTKAIGNQSTAMGMYTRAPASFAFANGYFTTASGAYCVATGLNTVASGEGATAFGLYTTASSTGTTSMGSGTQATNYEATAMGSNTLASGISSTAMGYLTVASGSASTAMGQSTSAIGHNSVAVGFRTMAKAFGSLSCGMFNDSTDNPDMVNLNGLDRLFQIGNGNSILQRNNALTVLRNGNVGIGIISPSQKLHIGTGGIRIEGPATPLSDTAAISVGGYGDVQIDAYGATGGRFIVKENNNVGIGTGDPLTRLHVSNGSVLFSAPGDINGSPGNTPVNGVGRRMMWYADKAAFRAGFVYGGQWDKDSIGSYSFATGNQTTALGFISTAMGYKTMASGGYSTALGIVTTASGETSTAMGFGTVAKAPSGFSVGVYNDDTDTPNPNATNPLDRIFQIGNGTFGSQRSNAVTVLRNGNVGIGQLNPIAPLSFKSVTGEKIVFFGDSEPNYGIGIQPNVMQLHTAYPVTDIVFGYGSSSSFTETMRVKGNGLVGIGTTSPAQKLDVNGTIHAANLNGGATTLSTDAAGNIIRTPSDARLKNNIMPISNPLSKVMAMHGVTYNFINTDRFGTNRQMGFLAQDLEKIIPEAVSSGGEYKSVNYPVLTALLAEAMKEQQKQIDELKKDKTQMQEQINELKKMMEKLISK